MIRSAPTTFSTALAALTVSALLALGALPAQAQTGFDPEGKYALVKPPQPTDTKDKVEVLDIFWYGCPHCYTFLPALESYEKSKADYVEMRRMPAVFRKNWENHARAYYTAKLLGVEHTLHRKLFDEIHKNGKRMDSPEELRAFFVANGVDGEAFDKTFDSFAVETLLRKSIVMQGRYGVRGTPSVIINGKYRTSGSLAGSYEDVIRVVEALAARENGAKVATR